MLLRPRQLQFKDRAVAALREHGNTLGVAPTGAGKTIMLSAVTGELVGKTGRALVIAHRDELTTQNREKFRRVIPGVSTGVYDASTKQLDRQVTFCMVQTMSRPQNLERLKFNPFDVVVVDEAHHIAASSYLKIIDTAREANPKCAIFGVTATPGRGDSKSLRKVFSNIADQITLGELIRAGNLVKPRTFVVDIGTQGDLRKVKKTAAEFDMGQVAAIMDKAPLTERIIEEWRKVAGDRKTIVFASTVEHAAHVAESFTKAGVPAEVVSGETPDGERAAILRRLDKGNLQVVVNCAVLIEGFDSQPVSCIVLLRPNSHKSVFIQMVGRGLRTVDPEIHPGVVKHDCIVLDFGTSVLTHGSLEQEASLGRGELHKHEAPKKQCPECAGLVPAGVFECPLCGYEFIAIDDVLQLPKDVLTDFALTEVDILNQSPFQWEDLWDGQVSCATAFDAWGMCVLYKGVWNALGGGKEVGIRVIARGERMLCLAAADDFLREHGDDTAAKKSKTWLKSPVTDSQLRYLGLGALEAIGMSRYRAACFLTFRFNSKGIQRKLEDAHAGKPVERMTA